VGVVPRVAPELLAAARRSDEAAFRALVEPHRGELHAHCYRMLGSLHDAEDALQDALLRAWRGLKGFDDRRLLRPWLYKIATNVCLDAIARRPRRVLPYSCGGPAESGAGTGDPSTETAWIEPYPDEIEEGVASPAARYERREAVELAFIAALQHLPGQQRAALILREVLGFSAKETAELLDTTVASVNSSLQRARKAIDRRLPDRSQQATLRALGDSRVRALVQRFIEAFERGDVDAIVALLTDDATFSMPPYVTWYRGRDRVAESWLIPGERPEQLRYLATRANGQLAVAAYRLDPAAAAHVPIALDVMTLRGDRIADVTAFRTPAVFPLLGLPERLPLR